MKRLNVDGYIIDDMDRWLYDLFEIPNLTLAKLRAFLVEANGDDIELAINCYGGDVFSAEAMYSELRGYAGKSVARVIALSASASSFLMLGCQRVTSSPMGSIMIHNAQSGAEGDYRDMEHAADVLKHVDEVIRNAYEAKTKKSRNDLKKYMDKETWLTPQEALELGIIDEIELKEGETLSDPKFSQLLPTGITNCFNPVKMHQLAERMKQNPATEPPNDSGDVSRPVSEHNQSPEQKALIQSVRNKIFDAFKEGN